VVSGRSVAQIDAILGPVAQRFAVSGSHGGEWRIDGEVFLPERPSALTKATGAMRVFARAHQGLFLEEKSLGTGFHFRAAPELGEAAVRFARTLAEDLGLFLQEGKMMVELRPAGHDKGSAIRGLMDQPLLAGAMPVFAGDDVTDETGFAAANDLGGFGVLVGDPRPSLASYRLPNPAAVRQWLREFAK
jgi:trehalose 6-phosphate phosphatase